MGIPPEGELAPALEDVEFLDVCFIGGDGELGDIGIPIEFIEVQLGGGPVHFQQAIQEVDFEAVEPKGDGVVEGELHAIVPIYTEDIVAGN